MTSMGSSDAPRLRSRRTCSTTHSLRSPTIRATSRIIPARKLGDSRSGSSTIGMVVKAAATIQTEERSRSPLAMGMAT